MGQGLEEARSLHQWLDVELFRALEASEAETRQRKAGVSVTADS